MVNGISSTSSSVLLNQQLVRNDQVDTKSLPENGLATIAQQPETYTVANKTLQLGLAKNQFQHTQNMIDAYIQDEDEASSELVTELSLTDLYKQAYKLEHGEFPRRDDEMTLPSKGDYMTIQHAQENGVSKAMNAYENNQPSVSSLFSTQV